MSLLNITNLTDNPEKWITDKYFDAIHEVEIELGIKISYDEQFEFINRQIEQLEEQMEEAKESELLSIIDNYLVNLDYYSEAKEWIQNR